MTKNDRPDVHKVDGVASPDASVVSAEGVTLVKASPAPPAEEKEVTENDRPDVHKVDGVASPDASVVSAEGVTLVKASPAPPTHVAVDVTTQVSIAGGPPSAFEPTIREAFEPTIRELKALIDRIRELSTKTKPAEEALDRLQDVRDFADIQRRRRKSLIGRIFSFRLGDVRLRWMESEVPIATQLSSIETELRAPKTEAGAWEAITALKRLDDATQIRVRRLHSTFIALLYSLTTSRELVDDLAQRIGHRELREEARVHSTVVAQLVKRLHHEGGDTSMEVLSDKFFGTIGIMTELEHKKLAVEELVHRDQYRRRMTAAFVIGYIAVVLALAIIVGIRWQERLSMGDAPLASQRLPLLGIPWPVIVWSLIGSFAAMIYRFNKRPIYDFGDAAKWCLTRPVQGVVLGSAFYLVLSSGLFLMTGPQNQQLNSANTARDVVLVLCFLVGFSDRFADAVFNAIVERYSNPRRRAEDADQQSDEADERPRNQLPKSTKPAQTTT